MDNCTFRQQFLRLAIVNILSNLMVPLAGLVDTAFLGHLSEIHHLAGVAIATILFNYIYWSFGFLRMSTTGMTAQAVGQGDRQKVLLIGARHGLLALGLGVVILILQYPLQELGFALLSATAVVKASGLDYYNALIWGAPATLLNFVLIGWFLGQRQGARVLLLSGVSNGANVILNYWLIVKWGWASAGAGWATALSQYLMLLVGLGFVSRMVEGSMLRAIAPHLFDPAALKAAFVLNSDILIRTFSLVSTFALFTNLSSILGTTVLAANTLLLQVITLAAYFIDGVAFATESFAGVFRGQEQDDRLMMLIRLAGCLSLGLGVVIALVAIGFPVPLFRVLTDHSYLIDQVQMDVRWLLPVLGFGSLAYMLDGYFLGLTEGQILRTSSLTATLVGFAPLAAIAWYFQNRQVLWLAMTAFMATRAITLGLQIPKTLRNMD